MKIKLLPPSSRVYKRQIFILFFSLKSALSNFKQRDEEKNLHCPLQAGLYFLQDHSTSLALLWKSNRASYLPGNSRDADSTCPASTGASTAGAPRAPGSQQWEIAPRTPPSQGSIFSMTVSPHDRSGKNRDAFLVTLFNYLPGSNKDFLRQMYLLNYVTTVSVYLFQKFVQPSLEPLWAFSTFSKHRISKHKYLNKPHVWRS